MKKNLIKISLIFLTVVIIANTYMLIIISKLSQCQGLFAKLNVINEYNVLQNMWLGAGSLFLTIVLLVIFFGFIVKEFVVKTKKVVV